MGEFSFPRLVTDRLEIESYVVMWPYDRKNILVSESPYL